MTEIVKDPAVEVPVAEKKPIQYDRNGIEIGGISDHQNNASGGQSQAPKEPDNKIIKSQEQIDAEAAEAAKVAEAAAAEEAKAKETADAEAKAKEEADKAPLTEYTKFEDPNAQAAVDLLKEAGVAPADANAMFEKAIASGDLKDVDWAAIEAKIGATKTLLLRNGVEKYYETTYKAAKETEAKVYDVLGGKENWDKVKQWSNDLASKDPAHKAVEAEIRKAIDMNGWIAEQAVARLKSLYEADPKNSGLSGEKKLERGDTNAAASGTPLTRAEYVIELRKANANKATTQADIAALDARRRAGMAKGI